MHYQRWRMRGDVNAGPRPGKPTPSKEEAFFAGVPEGLTASECWPWQGLRGEQGYGRLFRKGEWLRAHRYSYDLHFPGLTKNLLVRHRCHNPPCVNPHHLVTGTHKDNSADALEAGRIRHGESHRGAKLTEALVMQIRQRKLGGELFSDMSKELGCHQSTVASAGRGATWKHVPMPAQAAK